MLCSVLLGFKLLHRAVSGARFLTEVVFECDIDHRRSVAVTWTLCASASYTRCSGCTSVYLCAASLQNLAVSQDFSSPPSVPLGRSC